MSKCKEVHNQALNPSFLKIGCSLLLILLKTHHVSSSYFQSCEYVECFLFPKSSSASNIQQQHGSHPGEQRHTVMDVMRDNGLNKMADLLVKTGLDKNLTSKGTFTVFAIMDEGFDELALKAPTWFNSLTTNMTVASAILPNHIVEMFIPYAAIRNDVFATSLGGPIYFSSLKNGKGFAVNGSSRIVEDLEASNGRIYIVTNQIIEDIFSMLSFFPSTLGVDLSILVEALQTSGVSQMINDPTKGKQFTLFAPTDKAMKKTFPDRASLEELLKHSSRLKKLLLNHMLPNALFVKNDMKPTSGFLKTIGGASIPYKKNTEGKVTVGSNGAKILFANRPGNNGVVHIINKVIEFEE